ncbi:23S rRNA (adenine(2030)-N(6))-methyltransferase RlmJ [Brevundimonas sp. M20]|uniref:23S rRNA (adenine(2030)-N(6))-methyltransferase RlmJ n=1 Tax=Brevundimonas sp. M20 TaxID=2591463 RepID=UPI0011470289|nr:23S rRNA (adenine(2030)-N(6))-methyltransferase RlmJ [Brevundimonas sp. M20]QDH74165.1 23S rRNA (adenine(2030)-N(6))-methyltransferase RlmJ [Brevundimonas sp. M20]
MNYRHSFHAGNFADLVKHALVLWLLERRRATGAVTVLDTHAGAGVYDLAGDAVRSKEAEAGIVRLMAADKRPPLIEALARAVKELNPHGGANLYPGSPLLVARRLDRDDRYVGFELNPPVLELLTEALTPFPQASARGGDGYDQARAEAARSPGAFVLIDPPFERPDDYIRAADTAAAIVRADPRSMVAVWTPLKDMETFDGFLRRLDEAGAKRVLVAEARLRPLTNPMKMNGCAMVILNPPAGAEEAARQVCDWVAATLGDAGAKAEVWMA